MSKAMSKATFFFTITHGAFDIADPSSMQDVCRNEFSKYDLARHESPSSSVVRVSEFHFPLLDHESNYDKQIAVTRWGNSRLNTDSKHLFISFSRPHMPAIRGPFIAKCCKMPVM